MHTGTITEAFPFCLQRAQKRAEGYWEWDWATQWLRAKQLFSGLCFTFSHSKRSNSSASDRAHLAAADSCRSFTLKQLPVSPFSAQHNAQPLKNGVTEPQRLQNRAELPNRSTQLAFATPCAGTKASSALLECPLTTRTQTKWFWLRYAGAASSCWSQHWEVLQEKRTTRHLEHNCSFLGLFFVFFPSVQTDTLTQSARMILSSCTHWAN